MKVILRYAQVVEVDHVPFLPLIHPWRIMDCPGLMETGTIWVGIAGFHLGHNMEKDGIWWSCLPPN